MKKYVLSVFIISVCLSLTAQDATSEKFVKHELGFDATSLIGRVIGISPYGFWTAPYEPTYYVYYRAHIGKMRLRATAGGDHVSNDANVQTTETQFDYKIGAEFATQISKRFEFYYGLEGVSGLNRSYREWEYAGDYLVVYDYALDYVGVAPFMGVRFKITDRISLMSELSAVFRREQVKDNRFTKETLVPNPTAQPWEDDFNEFNQTQVLYTAPDFIVLSFVL